MRRTLGLLTRRLDVEFTEQRLEDIMTFLTEYSGAEIIPLWIDERTGIGMDKDEQITLKVRNKPVLTVIEMVLAKAKSDFGDPTANTWQLTPWGELEVGPKERLNRRTRLEIYDISDLLFEIPTYDEVPDIDLQSVLQSNQGGGGGGRSPFRNDQQNNENETLNRQDKAQEIIDLLTTLVEPEQWEDNGGDAASIRYFQGSIIVKAPDYIHRNINGYPFWPSRLQNARTVKGRRYVSLNMDTGISKLDGFGKQPVTAVVGGKPVRSDRPGGGG